MSDSLERYRQAWIQEQADEQKQLQAQEDAYRAARRKRATEFIAKHNLADLLAAFSMGNPQFPNSDWEIIFPLRIPHEGRDLPGTFCLFSIPQLRLGDHIPIADPTCLFSEGGEVMGAIECDDHSTLYLPATDAEVGRWIVDLEK